MQKGNTFEYGTWSVSSFFFSSSLSLVSFSFLFLPCERLEIILPLCKRLATSLPTLHQSPHQFYQQSRPVVVGHKSVLSSPPSPLSEKSHPGLWRKKNNKPNLLFIAQRQLMPERRRRMNLFSLSVNPTAHNHTFCCCLSACKCKHGTTKAS